MSKVWQQTKTNGIHAALYGKAVNEAIFVARGLAW
jgi:hypothetical protein